MSQSQEQGRIKVYHALVENELSSQLKKKEHLIIELLNWLIVSCVIIACAIIWI